MKRLNLILRSVTLCLLNVYQVCLRPYFATGCYFYPSCSEYAKESIQHKGAIKSIVPIIWRLLRCHPVGKKTRDLVLDYPETKRVLTRLNWSL